MKAASIAAIIVSLIVPVSAYGLPETLPDSQSPRIDSGGLVLALKNPDEGFNKNQSEISAIRWYQRKNPEKLNGVALVTSFMDSIAGRTKWNPLSQK
jgi:hypothetical protein